MENELQKELQESLASWAEIEKSQAEQEKKDKRIISKYCADHDRADIIKTLRLLNKYPGLPAHDKETVSAFEGKYPDNLSTKLIYEFEDVKDLYRKYLESGGVSK